MTILGRGTSGLGHRETAKSGTREDDARGGDAAKSGTWDQGQAVRYEELRGYGFGGD